MVEPLCKAVEPGLRFQLQGQLKGRNAVVQGMRHPQRRAGVGGIAVHKVVLFQIPLRCLAGQPHEDAEGLHALLLRQIHKALPVQPQPLKMGRALVDLQHVLLHVVGHLALRAAGQQLFHIIGRVRSKGLAHKTSVGAQVAVELEQQGEKGRAAPAIG